MKIIKQLSNNTVIFAGEELTLTELGAAGNGWTAPMLTSANAVLEPVTSFPDGYAGGEWTYLQGVWAALPEAQAGIAQRLAEKRAKTIAQKWEAIKAERDRRKFAGVKVGIDWFHCDIESRSQWERMVNRVNTLGQLDTAPYTIGGSPVPWKTMAGTFLPLTAGKIRAVVDAIELQEALIFTRAEQHRALMAASTDPSAYSVLTGWPETFGG